MKNRLTMSALPRTFACPSSLVLPHRDYRSSFADDGIEGHSEMETAAINRDWSKLPPRVAELLSEYQDENIYPELILVYDYVLDTARTLDKREARDYTGSGAYEIPGTADLVAVDTKRRRGLVVDYKQWEEVGAPNVNTQTLGYAAAVARVFDLDEVTVAISYLGIGKQSTEDAVLDDADFRLFALRLRALNLTTAAAVANPEAYLSLGRQCRWCPAFHDCPAQRALTVTVDRSEIDGDQLPVHLGDDADATRAYEFLARLKILSKRLSDAVYARAADRPIPLASGKVLGRVAKPGNLKLDGDTVYKVMHAKYGAAIADASVEREATQAKLEQGLRLAGVKVVSKAKAEILVEVAKLGGSSRKPTTAIEEVDISQVVPRELAAKVIAEANRLMVTDTTVIETSSVEVPSVAAPTVAPTVDAVTPAARLVRDVVDSSPAFLVYAESLADAKTIAELDLLATGPGMPAKNTTEHKLAEGIYRRCRAILARQEPAAAGASA